MAKEQRFIMIGWLVKGGYDVVGARLLNESTKFTKDVSISGLKAVLAQNPNLLDNVAYDVKMDRLVGIQGDIENITRIDSKTLKPIGNDDYERGLNSKCLIIRLIGDKGAEVTNYKGEVKKFPMPVVVRAIQQGEITNAQVIQTEQGMMVQSLGNPFRVMDLGSSRVGNNNNAIMSGAVITGDRKVVSKQLRQEGRIEAEYTDTFGALTPQQRASLVEFFVWYTVDTYSKMSKGGRLEVAPGKLQKLAALRGEESWSLGGIIDSYLDCKFDAKCSLGHSLRYEFFAVPTEKLQQIRKENRLNRKLLTKQQAKSTREKFIEAGAVVFGETCASDFFSIKKEDMQQLVKIRKAMTDEIQLMTNVFTNGEQQAYFEKHKLLSEILNVLISKNILAPIVGAELSESVMNFINSQLPMTKSMVIQICKKLRENQSAVTVELFEEHADLIRTAFASEHKKYANIKLALQYMFEHLIEGGYAYDPLRDEERTRKDVGAYNKDTRGKRAYEDSIAQRYTGLCTTGVICVRGKRYHKSLLDISLSDIKGVIDFSAEIIGADYKIARSLKMSSLYIKKPYNIEGAYELMLELRYSYLRKDSDQLKEDVCGVLSGVCDMHLESRNRNIAFEFNRRILDIKYGGNIKDVCAQFDNVELMESLLKEAVQYAGVYNATTLLYGHSSDEEGSRLIENFKAGRPLDYDEKKEQAQREQAQREQAQREQAQREQAQREQAPVSKSQEPVVNTETTDKVSNDPEKESEKERVNWNIDFGAQLKPLLEGKEFENFNDYGLTVARSIISYNKPWKDLSKKQKWRVKNTLDRIRSGELK